MTKDELREILDKHKLWLENKVGGVQANLKDANLSGVDLKGMDLRWAYMVGADLSKADLEDAILWEADLSGANLRGANLSYADLKGARLESVDLYGADLSAANLQDAYIRDANLSESVLQGANLREANLIGTDLRGVDLQGVYLWESALDEEGIKIIQETNNIKNNNTNLEGGVITPKDLLFEKMEKELQIYENWLEQQPVDTILNNAYMYAMKKDILYVVENQSLLSDNEARGLLKRKQPLDEIYKIYQQCDCAYIPVMEDVISDFGRELTKTVGVEKPTPKIRR